MSEPAPPGLDGLLEAKLTNFRAFREGQERLWIAVDSAYLAARTLIGTVMMHLTKGTAEAHRLMMWQTVLEYQMQSFFLLIDRQLDEGIALLRMSAELARDINRIADDEARLDIWLERDCGPRQKKLYRASFRFADDDPTEAFVHKLYDLASTFGIHGHMLKSMAGKPTKISKDGTVVQLEVSDDDVYRTLEIWLTSFFALQTLSSTAFRNGADAKVAKVMNLFDETELAFSRIVEQYREALHGKDGSDAALH